MLIYVLAIGVAIYLYLSKSLSLYDYLSKLITPSIDRMLSFNQENIERYGEIFPDVFLGMEVVSVVGVDALNKIAREEENGNVIGFWPDSFVKLLGKNNIMIAQGKHHTHLRKLISSLTRQHPIDQISSITKSIISSTPSTFNLQDLVETISLSITLGCLFGIDNVKDEITDWKQLITTWSKGLFSIPIDLPFTQFHHSLQARKQMITKCNLLLDDQLNEYSKSNKSTWIVSLTEEMQRDDIINLMIVVLASVVNEDSILISLIDQITSHSLVYEQLMNEIDGIDTLNATVLSTLPFLDACIKEMFRMRTPVRFTIRKNVADITYKSHIIKKGSLLFLNLQATQMFMGLKAAPIETFEPRRWLTMEKDQVLGFTSKFVAFGTGAHTCPGQAFVMTSLKTVLVTLLKETRLRKMNPEKVTKFTSLPTVMPKTPIILCKSDHPDILKTVKATN